MAAAAALALAAGGGAVAAATSASAATSTPGYLSITLTSSSDGSTSWNSGDPQLTVGPDTSTTYAQMAIDGVNGSSVPKPGSPTEPMFATDNYGAGSPRFVIELNNGNSLWGYPSKSDLNGPSMAWAENNGNTYGSYSTAYTAADASATTVKDAFIVADGDQPNATTDTLTNVEYNNQWVAPPQPLNVTGGTMVGYGSKCADDYRSGTANGTPIDLYTCNKTNAQNWWLEPDGTVRNNAGGPTNCLDDTAWGGQGTKQELYKCVGQANQTWTYSTSSGHLVNDNNGLCLDDPGWVTTNGTVLDIWGCVNQANEHWTQP
jgi:hypothetical protein